MPLRGRALLFGLNYSNVPESQLFGCINDVKNMADYLQNELKIRCQIYTDDINKVDTSAMGMVRRLYELALQTHVEKLDFVWIHYSGHGSYIRDRSNDERDGCDECLVPNDYQNKGLLPDDLINSLFSYFNPRTRIICVFDCCHSGTIGDLRYSWEGAKRFAVENANCKGRGKIITISGCLDNQVAADAYNVLGDKKYVGALTACMLLALKENKKTTWQDVFTLIDSVRAKLKSGGFSQICKLCSNYNLASEKTFIPLIR